MILIRNLLPYIRPHAWVFALGIAGLFLARVFEALVPLFLKQGIDSIAAAAPELILPTLGIAMAALMRYIFISISRRYIRIIGLKVCYELRRQIYNHLQYQDGRFFSRFPTGDLMARAINDINLIRQFVSAGLRTILVIIFSATVGFAFMFYESPSLTLLILPPLPIIAYSAYLMSKKLYENSTNVQEGFSVVSSQTQENLNGIRTIQAQVQEQREITAFNQVNDQYANHYMDLVRSESRLAALMPFFGGCCTILVLGFGGQKVLSGEISIGTFSSFFWYLAMVLWPIRTAGQMVTQWQRTSSACTRIFEILHHKTPINDERASTKAPAIKGQISFKSLSFSYLDQAHQRNLVLNNLTLEITTGETLAIIGKIGSGKSTFLRALVRMIDVPENQIYIDNQEIHRYPLQQLRREVALVLQDPFLFADTVGANITYDQPDREKQIIWQAARDAQLESTIKTLPKSIDTVIGERGITLSGGQKQRSTLARGLIRNAPILLLDDCFSAVDTETEEKILSNLLKLRRNKTTLLVSHRASTARHADRILVLDQGSIAEIGSHQQLMSINGHYAKLLESQGLKETLKRKLNTSA